ncbi:MAG: endopeptidase La, partial [Halieaceae bacterium]|nr:endopeptidase La [Halieaceae bacterium]
MDDNSADDAVVNGEILSEGSYQVGSDQAPAVADDVLPDTLHILPISTRPYFPGQVQPVLVNLQKWGSTLKAVGQAGHGLLGLAFVDGLESDQAGTGDIPMIGCVVRL